MFFNKFSSKHTSTFFICLTILVIIIIFHSFGIFQPIEDLFINYLSPISVYFFKGGAGVRNFFSLITNIAELEKKNQCLQKRIEELTSENAKLVELEEENKVLREQLDFIQKTEYEVIPAQVFSHDPLHYLQAINIDKGLKDGLKENMPVIVSGGLLIGRTEEVYQNFSKILLTTDPASKIYAKVSEQEATGIVSGGQGFELIMESIPYDKEIKEGDIVTTVRTENFPSGLVIGEIKEVQKSESELFQKARIVSLFNFNQLKIVFVIKSW